MPTLEAVTGCERGVVIWENGGCLLPLDWRGSEGLPTLGTVRVSPDLMSKVQKLTAQDLPQDTREKLSNAGKGASIAGLWRIGGTLVATFEGSDRRSLAMPDNRPVWNFRSYQRFFSSWECPFSSSLSFFS